MRRDVGTPDEAVELFRSLARGLRPAAGTSWTGLDLTMAQVKALFVVGSAGPLPIGGVAQRLGIGLPAASNLVERLVEQGVVVRRPDPNDRRRALAVLTEGGEALVASLHEGTTGALRRWLELIEPADLAALLQGLRALASAASTTEAAAATAAGGA